MRLYLFDDEVADGWAPFALTRPCSELLFGSLSLRARLEVAAGVRARGCVTRPWLARFRERGAPPVVEPGAIGDDEPRLFLSSRFVPEAALPGSDGAPLTLHVGGDVVGARLPAGVQTPDRGWFRSPAGLPRAEEVEVDGLALGPVWELVARNPDRLLADLRAAADGGAGPVPSAPARAGGDALPAGAHRIGSEPLLLGEGVRIEPGVLLDTRLGPIRLDDGVEVRAGTRLAGPLHAGPGCRLLGGPLGLLSAGATSYLKGEVEASVVLGYVNKAHDGYLGHAYLGRWVNLGALTTNSDLKNNYSTVRIGPPGRRTDTGLLKLGCLLGDHVKTSIGLMIGTGTVVGAGSNLVGGAPATWVPPFTWGTGPDSERHRREAFLRTARTVMARRGVEADEEATAWLGAAWDAARDAAEASSGGRGTGDPGPPDPPGAGGAL